MIRDPCCHFWKMIYRPLIRSLDPGELCAQSKLLENLRYRYSDALPTTQLIDINSVGPARPISFWGPDHEDTNVIYFVRLRLFITRKALV